MFLSEQNKEGVMDTTTNNWNEAKKAIRKLGVLVNTRVPSCELGCSCVGGTDWDREAPVLWQTGKRFSTKYGGYLNHANLSDELKWKIMAVLNENKLSWEWSGESSRTILVELN